MCIKPTPETRLPGELEREIFVIAALSFPQCILALLLVARRVHIWVEPELYRIVSDREKVIPPLYSVGDRTGLLDLDRLRKFGPWVKHVLLEYRPIREVIQVLECCPNVHDLSLRELQGPCIRLIPILEKLPLRWMSFDPMYFFQCKSPDVSIPFDQPTFHNLTHLVVNTTSSWTNWQQLARLPKLTHIAMMHNHSVNQQLIDHITDECASLELFVLFYWYNRLYVDGVTWNQKDPRVVIMRAVQYNVFTVRWGKGSLGEEDFWITAEKRKQRGSRQLDGNRGRGLDRLDRFNQ
ncbi:hypothetical protein BDZ97DRAFT_301773 [Flammula alnicola]|nr:hypothetical protein BDZ97DRAFT_301773 [Flammula alnicola]